MVSPGSSTLQQTAKPVIAATLKPQRPEQQQGQPPSAIGAFPVAGESSHPQQHPEAEVPPEAQPRQASRRYERRAQSYANSVLERKAEARARKQHRQRQGLQQHGQRQGPNQLSDLVPQREMDWRLMAGMLKAGSWTAVRELMQRHQEEHGEALRLEAVAAAAAAAAATAPASEGMSVPSSEKEPPPRGSSTAVIPGVAYHTSGADVAERAAEQGHAGGGSKDASRWARGAAPHQLPPAPSRWRQSAFSARHLATALHVTSQLVPEPGDLGHAERMELADFVAALGRACAALPAGSFAPVDLTMALRALARLLGDGGADGAGGFGGVGPGDVGLGGVDGTGGVPRGVSGAERWVGDWVAQQGEQVPSGGAEPPDEDGEDDGDGAAAGHSQGGGGISGGGGGGAVDVAVAASSGRVLHAAWLDERWLDRLLGPTVELHLPDFEPRHTSGVLWALATLGARPRPQLLAALCERAAAQCANAPGRGRRRGRRAGAARAVPPPQPPALLTPQGLSLVLWALGRLGFHPRPAVLSALVWACVPDMEAAAEPAAAAAGRRCCSVDLAQRVWALAALGRQPGRSWLDSAVRAFLALGSVEQVSSQSCGMFMWALAQFSEAAAAAAPAAPAATAGSSSGDSGSSLSGAAAAGGVPRPTAAAATSGAEGDKGELLRERTDSHSSASTSGRRDSALPLRSSPVAAAGGANSALGAAAAAMGEDAFPGLLMAGGGGVAGGGVVGGGGGSAVCVLSEEQLVPLLRLLRDALPRMSPPHLATCLWALARMGVRPSQAWLEAFLEASARRMGSGRGGQAAGRGRSDGPFEPWGLSLMLVAFAELRYKPPFPWMFRFMEVCYRQLPSFGPHSTATLAWAIRRLNYRPPGYWAVAFAGASARMLRHMSPLGLGMLLWATSGWRVTMPMVWVRAAMEASVAHLRAGADGWARATAALEGAAARSPPAASAAAAPLPLPLGAEQLAMLAWSVPRLLERHPLEPQPSAEWLAAADAATAAAVRHSRAAAAAAAAAGAATAAAAPPGAMDARTLAMLLQGWAWIRRPLPEGCLAAALSYFEDAAAAAGAPAGVRPQHVVMALWSCAEMGWTPPADTLGRMVSLHSRLVLMESGKGMPPTLAAESQQEDWLRQGPEAQQQRGRRQGGQEQREVEKGQRQREQERQQRRRRRELQLVGESLAARQAELGMMLWALLRSGAATAPDWLPAVLAIVGARLEQDAAAAAAAAAAAGEESAAEAVPPPPAPTLPSGSSGASDVTATGPSTAFSAVRSAPPPPSATAADTAASGGGGGGGGGGVTLLTAATLARACLEWGLHPGQRWVAAAAACLESGVLSTQLRNPRWRANLEAELTYLLDQLRGDQGGEGQGAGRGKSGWAAAEAAGGAVLTNAVAAMAAGSAAAWMQGLVW